MYRADYTSIVQRKEERTSSNEGRLINYYGILENERELLIKESTILKPYRIEVLAGIADLLNSMGVMWWLSDGTLLGWYRNNQSILPHDYDVDVSVLEDDLQAIWKNRAALPSSIILENKGPTDKTQFVWVTDEVSIPYDPSFKSSKKLAAYHTNVPPKPQSATFFWDASTDIITFSKNKANGCWSANFHTNGGGINDEFPDDVLFPLVESKFEGIRVYVPQKPKEYLEILYGYIGEDAVWDPATNKYKQR